MSRNGGTKYYAVANGRQNGVYRSWAECSDNVTGHSGAIYKSFPSRAQAEAYIRENRPQQGIRERVTSCKVTSCGSSFPRSGALDRSQEITDNYATTYGSGEKDYAQDRPYMAFPGLMQSVSKPEDDAYLSPSLSSSSASSYHSSSMTPIEIFTDGSSRGNGTNGASAGYGVYFGPGDSRNLSARLPGSRQTNQRAELMAITEALKAVPSNQAVIIKTDSQYSISCFTVWKTTWLRNGWRNARGGEVENRDLIQYGLELIEARRSAGGTSMLQKVPAHSGVHGNEMADRLANEGAMKPLL